MSLTAWRNRIVGQGEEAPDQLLANPKNWRTHPGNQREALRGALDQVGWVQQVMVNRVTGHIVDGHARVEEALTRGEPTVPVLYVELEPHEEDVILATLDPIGAMATRDDERLRMLLAEVEFDAQALRDMTDALMPADPKRGLTDPDDVPELADDSGIKPGDLFALGDHRLMCGDSTKAEDVARLMGGAKADMVFTDPPYGVEVTSRIGTRGVASSAVRGSGRATVANDGLNVEALTIFLRSAFAAAVSATEPGAAWYVCAPQGPVGLAFAVTLAELDVWRHGLVWVKDSLVMGRADYHYRHEAIYYGWTPGGSHHAITDRTQDSVWEFPRPKRSEQHPTMKPVELVARAVTNSTDSRQVVLDPFSGSGTTIIAAEQLGRRCYAMDIDPRYVAVAIKRWEQFTGRKAVKINGPTD